MSAKSPDKDESKKDQKHAAEGAKATNRMFGKYRIQRKVGSGGMGSVYLAHDTDLNREVALKILTRDKANNPILLKRFKSEAKAAATLKNPHIVMVYEAGEIDGFYYIAMEYVEGIDVHRLIVRKEQIGVRRTVEIVRQAAEALQHIYERGIVHRDIKPSNLFIQPDGTVKLGDLGLARSIEASEQSGVTRDGTTVGTVDYIAPEQARDSRAADIRSDLYSLGCTWYHMLTGFPPYPDGSLTNKLHAHAVQPPPNPKDKNPTVPDGVVAVLNRMMAKKPEERYQSPKALIAELKRPALLRTEIADEVLDSLSMPLDDLTDTTPTPPSIPVTDSDQSPEKVSTSAPPSKEWKPKSKEKGDDNQFEFNIDPIKFVLVICVLGAVLAGIGWLIWSLSISTPVGNIDISDERLDLLKNNDNDQQPVGNGKKNKKTDTDENLVTIAEGNANNKESSSTGSVFTDLSDEDRQELSELNWIQELVPRSYRERLKDFTVNSQLSGNSPNGLFPDLSTAFRNAPNEGAIINLMPGTEHELSELKPLPLQQIVIKGSGDSGARPRIIVRPGHIDTALIQLSGSSLVLENVDFIVMPDQSDSPEIPPLFQLKDGRLGLRNSSITVAGSIPVTIIESSTGDDKSLILVDHALITGDYLTLFADRSLHSQFVGTHSFIFSRFGSPFLISPVRNSLPDSSTLRLYHCTVTTQDALFRIPSANSKPYLLKTHDSLFGSLGPDGVFILSRPALVPDGAAEIPSSDFNLKWENQNSLFSGWAPLIKSVSPEMPALDSHSAWNEFWGHSVKPEDVRDDFLKITSSPNASSPTEFSPAAWGFTNITGNQLPGANLPLLNGPRSDLIASLVDQEFRNNVSLNEFVFETDVLEFDLSDRAQGEIKSSPFVETLKQNSWESGTRFILNGSGEVQLPPISIENKSAIIELNSIDPQKPLFFRPLRSNSASSMIKVSNGSLVLENVRIDARKAANGEIPAHLIHASSSNLHLSNCQLESGYEPSDSSSNKPVQSLILWTEDSEETSTRYLKINDSFAYGLNPLILSNVEQTACEIDNSSLVSRSNVFSQEIQSTHTNPLHLLSIKNSSLSAAHTVYQLRNNHPDQPPYNSLQLGLHNLYLASPFSSANEPASRIVSYTGIEPLHPFVSLSHSSLAMGVRVSPTMVSATTQSDLPVEPSADDYELLTGLQNPFTIDSEITLPILPLKYSSPEDWPRAPQPTILEYDTAARSAELDKDIRFGSSLGELSSDKPKKKKSPSKWKNATPKRKSSQPQF